MKSAQSRRRSLVGPAVGHGLRPFPMVVGRERSGTTLLRAMLDSHPEMAIPEESYFLVTLARRHPRYEHRPRFAVDAFLQDVFAHPRFAEWGLPEEEARLAFEERPPADYPAAVRTLYRAYARRQGKPRYGDKTPTYVMHIRLLSTLFQEARFIHIIRDGRDASLSYVDAEFGPTRLDDAAVYWKRFVQMGRRAGRRLGPSRYREVRYEDLLDDAESVVRELCGFLELDFDQSMLRYHERAGQIVGEAPHHSNLSRPPTRGLRDWRNEMSREQIVLFESLAGDLLEDLGYERAVPHLPLPARLGARWRWLRVRASHGIRRALKAGSAALRGGRASPSKETL